MVRGVPSGAVLKKEVDVVLRFWEIDELDYVLMVDALPGFDLIFEGVDEVLFCEGLVLGEVDLLD